MKLLSSLFVLFVLSNTNLFAQNDTSLYLIMAYVDNYTRDTSNIKKINDYPKIIWEFDRDTLLPVDTLNYSKNNSLEILLHYPKFKIIYIEEKNMYTYKAPNLFTFIDYSSGTLKFKRYNSIMDSSYHNYLRYRTSLLLDSNIVISTETEKGVDKNDFIDYGFDKKFVRHKLTNEDFQHVYKQGISGMQYTTLFSYIYPYGNFSKLKIGRISDYTKMPDAPYQPPENYVDKEEPVLYLKVNNSKYFAYVKSHNNVAYTDSIRRVYYYDKKNLTWDSISIPGSSGVFRTYGNYFYGTSVNSVYNLRKYHKHYYDSLVNNFKLDNNYYSIHGNPPNLIGFTGRLFLVHLPTKKVYKWDTGNIDSEIIRIINDKVYYRVFDELRVIKIDKDSNELDLNTDKILIKNHKIIPYVHWLFYSKADLKAEEKFIN